jgi:glycerol-3-phosphate cytidylyltransferase|tara:strand:+ start:1401 stop:1802 length:402 start_codon:yes stop_codon:yes gene_type:complete
VKFGITASSFDLLHSGHIAMLREAKSVCDYLICALHVDPSIERGSKNKPVQSIVERYIQLSAIECVGEIVPYESESDLIDIMLSYPVGIRIIGEEYKNTFFSGSDMAIEFHFNKRRHRFSTTELRQRVVAANS